MLQEFRPWEVDAYVKTILLITHPEATHHVAQIVGGWHDSTLTDRGREHAALIAASVHQYLGPAQSEIYTSDLRRATETAEIIGSRLGITPIEMHALREKSYGVAEGRPQGWLNERFIPPPRTGDRMDHDEGIEGAETKAMFASRVYAAFRTIVAQPAEHQLIVTHGFALTFLVAAWIGMGLDDAGVVNFRSSSGGITELRQDDYFNNRAVVRLNDLSHLA